MQKNMKALFSESFNQFKTALLNKGFSSKDISFIEKELKEKIENEKPPQIAIIGFCGVGKSSTLNALFNAGRPTSDVEACTKEATAVSGDIEPYIGSKGTIEIYDMPGLGEDIDKDPEYYEIYADVLPKVDAIIWTFNASDRVMAPMQQAINKLVRIIGYEFVDKILFAVNKADTAAPGESDWNKQFNIPSPVQQKNLVDMENYIREKVKRVIPKWNGPIVSYSAKYRYHLDELMTAMVEVMPKERKWVLNNIADVADYTELIDQKFLQYINEINKKK